MVMLSVEHLLAGADEDRAPVGGREVAEPGVGVLRLCVLGLRGRAAALTLLLLNARRHLPPVVTRRGRAKTRYVTRPSRRACSAAVRSAVGIASSRSSGIGSPLSTERP